MPSFSDAKVAFVNSERGFASKTHQREFVFALARAASEHDGIGAQIFGIGIRFSQAVEKRVGSARFHGDAPAGNIL